MKALVASTGTFRTLVLPRYSTALLRQQLPSRLASPATLRVLSKKNHSSMPSPPLPSLLTRATADLYDDFLDDARVPLDIAWQSYGSLPHFAGAVVTVKCFEDNSRIKECAQSPGHGQVLVVDAGGSRRCAVLGDWIAEQARDQGWRGIIVYGCVRDVAVLRTLEHFGVVALGSIPRKSTRRGEGQVNLPIRLGNVEVTTGDYVVADADGLLFLTAEQVAQSESNK